MTVKDKHDGFAEMRDEFARTHGGFDRYAEQFWSDVRNKRQLAVAFRTEVADMQSAFEQAVATFDAYADEFEEDVLARHDAVAAFRDEIGETRDAFEATLAEFESYTGSFDRDVVTKQGRVDNFEEEIAVTRAAFEEALEEFDRDVDARHQEVETFLESVEDVRAAYEQVREEFSQAVVEFYGAEEESIPGEDEGDDAPTITPDDATETPATDSRETGKEEPEGEVDQSDGRNGATVVGTESTPIDEQLPTEEPGMDDPEDDPPEDMVECLVCGEYYQAVTESHLQTHDMSMSEYKSEYGADVALFPGGE